MSTPDRSFQSTIASGSAGGVGDGLLVAGREVVESRVDEALSLEHPVARTALRRAGAPYELSPSQLTQHLVLSSGGLSLMLDRFERAGLVRRRPNPDDRRGVLVALTDAGLEVIDEAMTRLADVEQQLVGGLTTRERDHLARLLAKYHRTNDEV